jgi:hypothetical protein
MLIVDDGREPRNREIVQGCREPVKPAHLMHRILSIAFLVAASPSLLAAPEVHIALPERCRLLTRQYFDLRVEARSLTDTSGATLVLRDDSETTSPPGSARRMK